MKTQHTHAEYSLSQEEVVQLINTSKDFRNRCILKSLYYGGMRVSEVVKLSSDDINWDRRTIDIMDSKCGKSRTIPIIDQGFLADLMTYCNKKKSETLFPITDRMVRHIVRKVGETAKLKNPNPLLKYINPHIFRHSIARHLKDQGYPMEFVQKFLGHASMKTTADMYGTLSLLEQQKIVYRKTGQKLLLPQMAEITPEIVIDKLDQDYRDDRTSKPPRDTSFLMDQIT